MDLICDFTISIPFSLTLRAVRLGQDSKRPRRSTEIKVPYKYSTTLPDTTTMFFDYSHLEFSRPVKQVKTINVEPIPLDIFDGMTKYEDAARGKRT